MMQRKRTSRGVFNARVVTIGKQPTRAPELPDVRAPRGDWQGAKLSPDSHMVVCEILRAARGISSRARAPNPGA
jgi:hypothetical protein